MHATSDRKAIIAGLILALLSLSAPAHSQSQEKHVTISGSKGDVDIRTGVPSAKELGLTVYPGAKPKAEGDDGAASVKVQTSEGRMRVQVMNFSTPAAAATVLSFYKKDLARYGQMLECRGSKIVSLAGRDPDHKSKLTCNSAHEDNATVLRSGSEQNEHSVVIRDLGKGTEFTLIHVTGTNEHHETL